MPKAALTLLAAALLAQPAFAQGVRITLTDGKTVLSGELLSYEGGRYRLRLSNGTTREIAEDLVREVVLTDRASSAPSAPSTPLDGARAAFERGDYERALQEIAGAHKALEEQRQDLNLLATRAAQGLLEGLLQKKETGRFADALRKIAPLLPPESRQELLARLTSRFSDQLRAAPGDPFTAAFAEVLARLADEGTVAESMRASLADLFVQVARASTERKSPASAVELYRGAIKMAPARRDSLKGPLLEALLAQGRALQDAGDPKAAAQAAREALALEAGNADAQRLHEEADFAWVKQESDVSYGAEAVALLREYLTRAPRPERRTWAEQALRAAESQSDPRSASLAAQMRKYFPARPGRFLVYRRGEGDTLERVKTDSVTREGDVLKVYSTLKEIFRDYSTSKVYLIEMEKDAVAMTAGADRETILKFPIRLGESWSWQSRGREFRRTVVSVNAVATVGREDARRTYSECLQVAFTSSIERGGAPVEITSKSTYAPGVGLVRLEFDSPEFHKFNLELVDSGVE